MSHKIKVAQRKKKKKTINSCITSGSRGKGWRFYNLFMSPITFFCRWPFRHVLFSTITLIKNPHRGRHGRCVILTGSKRLALLFFARFPSASAWLHLSLAVICGVVLTRQHSLRLLLRGYKVILIVMQWGGDAAAARFPTCICTLKTLCYLWGWQTCNWLGLKSLIWENSFCLYCKLAFYENRNILVWIWFISQSAEHTLEFTVGCVIIHSFLVLYIVAEITWWMLTVSPHLIPSTGSVDSKQKCLLTLFIRYSSVLFVFM